MATDTPKNKEARPDPEILAWLLDSDPAIRWQVLRDVMGASVEDIAAERVRVATQGLGCNSAFPSSE